MGGAPSIPQQNIGAELGQVLQFMPQFTQKSYGLAQQYAPKFAGLDISTLSQYAPQYAQMGLDLTKQFGGQYAQQGLDVTKQFGGQYAQAGLDVAKQFGPQYLGLNQAQMAQNIAGQPLLKELNAQAQQELGQQGRLSPQEAYQATQGSLTPFAGRNNVFNQAEATAFLDRDALVRQRRQQAQQFASGVQNLDLSQLSGIGGVVNPPNLPGYAQAPNLAGYAQQPNLAAYAAPGSGFAPMQSGIGASSGVSGQLFPFASNIFDANQSAAANQAIGGSNKSSGIIGGVTSALGTAAAAY